MGEGGFGRYGTLMDDGWKWVESHQLFILAQKQLHNHQFIDSMKTVCNHSNVITLALSLPPLLTVADTAIIISRGDWSDKAEQSISSGLHTCQAHLHQLSGTNQQTTAIYSPPSPPSFPHPLPFPLPPLPFLPSSSPLPSPLPFPHPLPFPLPPLPFLPSPSSPLPSPPGVL